MAKAYDAQFFQSKSAHPSQTASFFSKLFFWWAFPLIWLGFRREVQETDFEPPPEADRAESVGASLAKLWKTELKKEVPSLKRAVFKMFGVEFCVILSFMLFQQCILQISMPLLLGCLIRYLSGLYSNMDGAVLSGLFILVTFLSSIIEQLSAYRLQKMAMRIRVSLTSVTYQKALRLSQASLSETGLGQLINIMTNDVNRFDESIISLPYVLACPIQLLLVGVVLWSYTGPSCLSGIGFLIIMVPVLGLGGRVAGRMRSKVAEATDGRVRFLSEVLNGMLQVKMVTWEEPCRLKMEKLRSTEIRLVQKRLMILGFNFSVFDVLTRMSLLLTFLTYILLENPITVQLVFVTLSMYNMVSATSAIYFPWGVMARSEMLISLARIQKILLMEEKAESQKPLPLAHLPLSSRTKLEIGVSARNLSATWTKGSRALFNVSLDVRPGELIGLIGPSGSGKSTLIQAILGEVSRDDAGSLTVHGTVAYASQEPCFFPGSVKTNILFGQPFDPTWYETVVQACALEYDLRTLVHGDETLVGDKGLNLSGGQRARISLARAVYSRADIYLLDDPLSAVDVRVARHLMDKCIGGTLRDKCVVLVTHQSQYLKEATEVIRLESGRVSERGSYKHVCGTLDSSSSEDAMAIDDLVLEDDDASAASNLKYNTTQMSLQNGYGTFEEQRPAEEQRGTGLVKWKLYMDYLRAGSSSAKLVVVLLLALIAQVFFSGSDLFLQQWTKAIEEENSNATSFFQTTTSSEEGFLFIYAGFVVAMFVFAVLRAITLFRALLKSSVAVHARLFAAIMRAPMRFFEINSVGRVLNRFSNDVGIMDEFLPEFFYIVLVTYLQVLGSMVLVVSMNSALIVSSLVLVSLLILLRRVYVGAATQIKRFEGTARSPVHAQLSATIEGLSVVRAFKTEAMMLEQFYTFQNTHTSKFIMYLAAARWCEYSVVLLTDFYISSILLVFVLFSSDGSAFGLAISAALTLMLDANSCVTQSTELGNQIIAVERTMEYASVKPEAPLRNPSLRHGPSWLQRGSIRLDNVFVAYANGAEVLRDITLKIRSGEKIGIVGRTGAGKSSLIASLFRIVEPKRGTLHISNVDICELGLHDLRTQFSIITQNPILFSGTLRQNLDPLNVYCDADIWNALDAVQLETRIRQSGGRSLDVPVSEGGSNFSHGERQLLCLARTILRKSKILILDEATANVDTRTDSRIQETLRKRFRGSTVLTIAHRLDTVMDNDRILALDAGEIKDFDEPSTLLRNPKSFLYKLVQSTGPANLEKLRTMADKARQRRQKEALAQLEDS